MMQNALVGVVDVDGQFDVYRDTPVEGTIEQTAANLSHLAVLFGVEDAPSKLRLGPGGERFGYGSIDWATGIVTEEPRLPAASFALLIDEDTNAIHILGYSDQRVSGEWVRIAYMPASEVTAARGGLHRSDAALPMAERAGKPVTVTATVVVTAPSPAAVARVLAERLLPDEDYGFDYSISYN